MRKALITVLMALCAACLALGVSCETVTHNFSAEWTFDDSYHWHACTDDGCNEIIDKAEHAYIAVGTVNTCNTCGLSFDTAATYEITVLSVGGTVLSGVDVELYNGNERVASAKTNVRGKARFKDLDSASYTAKILSSSLPKGYYIPDGEGEAQLDADNMSATVSLPSSLIMEEMPNGTKYTLGSIVHDFSTKVYDEKGDRSISLSAYLATRKAVILNFWFAGCAPCRSEFPHMDEAYMDYKDEIALIAIDNGSDREADVNAFVRETGYKFDFVNKEDMFSYYTAYGANAFPTTVVIDRYGAVAAIDSGSRPSVAAWKNMFEYYSADDYVPDYTSSYEDSEDNSGEAELTKPDKEMPESSVLAAAANGSSALTKADTFTYSAYKDEGAEYSWPWEVTELDGVKCIQPTNQQRVASYSILVIDVELKKGQQILFDYLCSTEADGDYFIIQVDSVLQHQISGEFTSWKENVLLYAAREDGKYQITLTYQKSNMTNAGKDSVFVKNIRLEEGAQINGHYDLTYNAATNYTLDENAKIPAEYKGFINHVAYYLSEDDGLYHVALSGDASVTSEDDPVLYADLYYATPWNELSVWILAYAGVGLFNPVDENYKEGYAQAMEDYAWLQQNATSRYVPVTKELKDILVDVVADLGRHYDEDDPDWNQDPFKGVDQWLEVCRYYYHYGTADAKDICFAYDNTVEALNWRVAPDCGEVGEENVKGNELIIDVNVYSVHLPRGNYYKFTPTTSGAYLVRSIVPIASDFDVNSVDPLGFIAGPDGVILDENDNYVIEVQGYDEDNSPLFDNNFYIYIYLEKGVDYYVGCCFNDPYAMGEYQVSVTYIGEEYSYFTACAYDEVYTYDIDDPSFTPYIRPKMGKDRFFIGDDGNYYAQEFDGSQGSLIYVKIVGSTFFNAYTSYTLEEMILGDKIGKTLEEKLFLKDCLIQARSYDEDDPRYGCVPASEKLIGIINGIANGEDSDTYASTSWLLTAYYYRNIDLNSLHALEAAAKAKAEM